MHVTFPCEGSSHEHRVTQLAFEKKWWGVKNLIRRKVVPEAEMFQKHMGKSVIQWTSLYGETGFSQELTLYFIIVRYQHVEFPHQYPHIFERNHKFTSLNYRCDNNLNKSTVHWGPHIYISQTWQPAMRLETQSWCCSYLQLQFCLYYL